MQKTWLDYIKFLSKEMSSKSVASIIGFDYCKRSVFQLHIFVPINCQTLIFCAIVRTCPMCFHHRLASALIYNPICSWTKTCNFLQLSAMKSNGKKKVQLASGNTRTGPKIFGRNGFFFFFHRIKLICLQNKGIVLLFDLKKKITPCLLASVSVYGAKGAA